MLYAFGPFTLSPAGLHCGGRDVELPPTPLNVLRELVANSPATVPHRRLAVAAWHRGRASSSCIARAIHRVRRTLDEHHPSTGGWVETVQARGYRFAPEAHVVVRPLEMREPSRSGARTGESALAARWCIDADALVAIAPERLDDAARQYARASALDPGSVHARRGLAECAIWTAVTQGQQGPASAALQQLAEARRIAPRDPRVQACRALAAIVAQPDHETAHELVRLALAAAPHDSRVAWYSGLVAFCTGEREFGLGLLAAAALREPSHERLRRHWLAASSGIDPGSTGLHLLQALDGVRARTALPIRFADHSTRHRTVPCRATTITALRTANSSRSSTRSPRA